MRGLTEWSQCPPVLIHRAEEELDAHLDVLLQLELMLARQLFVLLLELGDEELSLQLLLVFESQQLLLQLLLLVVCKRFREAFRSRRSTGTENSPRPLTDDGAPAWLRRGGTS